MSDDADQTAPDHQDGEAEAADGSARTLRGAEVSEAEQREIAEERKRRLDPANRPANTEVDNSGRVIEDDDEDGTAKGTSDPGKKFRETEVSEEEKREIAEERERRLDPANRPDNAEVDNTGRTFEDGEFKD